MTAPALSPLAGKVATAIKRFFDLSCIEPANGFMPEDIANAALSACQAEFMLTLLQRLEACHFGDRVFDEAAVYEVWRDAGALLAKLESGE
jgi:hypothetical protein